MTAFSGSPLPQPPRAAGRTAVSLALIAANHGPRGSGWAGSSNRRLHRRRRPRTSPPMPQAPSTGVSNPDQAPPHSRRLRRCNARSARSPDVARTGSSAPMRNGPYGEIHDQADDQDTTVTNTNTIDKNGIPQHLGSTDTRICIRPMETPGLSSPVSTSPCVPQRRLERSDARIVRQRTMAHGKFIWLRAKASPTLWTIQRWLRRLRSSTSNAGAWPQQEELDASRRSWQEQEQLARSSLRPVPTPYDQGDCPGRHAIAKLKAEKDAQVSQQELAEIQSKLANFRQAGRDSGAHRRREGSRGEKQGHLGELQGNLGEQRPPGRATGQAGGGGQRKVKSIIDRP